MIKPDPKQALLAKIHHTPQESLSAANHASVSSPTIVWIVLSMQLHNVANTHLIFA